ncbi:STM3941 family protein [Rhizobium sp. BK376]|uniref:STM3941 family protein n=1 Tax=Rhizobium sp. BK376 TaxID=2512149 RepID=UPI0010484F8A|nr:STM3941 family protein [Rhizobium sp. BK376]TCR83786.1 hypothetical protein EV561_10810 [Rhizobium sp. BK376]
MLFERFPRIELSFNIAPLLGFLAAIGGCAAAFGAIYYDVSGINSFSRPMDPTLAGFLFYFFSAALVFFIYRLIRINPLKPVLIIDKEGFRDSRYTREMIPWNCIKEVSLRHRPYKKGGNFVEVVLSENLPEAIRAQIESKKWMNYRKDGLVISISGGVTGMNAERIARTLMSYKDEFGPSLTLDDAIPIGPIVDSSP